MAHHVCQTWKNGPREVGLHRTPRSVRGILLWWGEFQRGQVSVLRRYILDGDMVSASSKLVGKAGSHD